MWLINRNLNIIIIIVAIIVMAIGIKVRYNLMETHFGAGVDDFGVAKTIFDFKDSLPKYNSRISIQKMAMLNEANGIRIALIASKLNAVNILDPLLRLRLYWNYIHAIPKSWTYAPFQFYFTTLLIDPGMDYANVKFWGRFPSFLFSILSIFVLAFFFYKFSDSFLLADRNSTVLMATTLGALSWQSIVYAAQMHSFAIGVLAISTLFLMLGNIVNQTVEYKGMQAFFTGLLLGLLTMTQYQVLLFLPGFVIALLYYHYHLSIKVIFFRFIQILGGFGVIAIPFVFSFLYKLQNSGINWNKGPDSIYLLDIPNQGGLIAIWNFFIFFMRNIPEVIKAMLSPIAKNSLILMICLSVFALAGFISLFEKIKIKLVFLIFLAVTFFIWIILIVAQKITLSPSRHSMVLIPIFIFLIILGVDFINRRIFTNTIGLTYRIFILGFSIFWLTLFSNMAFAEINSRNDPYEEKAFLHKLSRDKVDYLLSYESTYSVNLMPSVLSKYTLLEINDPWGARKEMGLSGVPFSIKTNKHELIVAAYSSARSFSASDLEKLKEQFGNIAKKEVKKIEKVSVEEQVCRIGPDWDFPLTGMNSFCGFYYNLIKIII